MLASILAPFEDSWSHLGVILGPFGAILGPSWGHVVGHMSHLGTSSLGNSWSLIETILAPFEPSRGLLAHLEASEGGLFGPFWNHLDANLFMFFTYYQEYNVASYVFAT